MPNLFLILYADDFGIVNPIGFAKKEDIRFYDQENRNYTYLMLEKESVFVPDRKKPGGRKQINYFCETCKNKPAMHIATCFKVFHNKKMNQQKKKNSCNFVFFDVNQYSITSLFLYLINFIFDKKKSYFVLSNKKN